MINRLNIGGVVDEQELKIENHRKYSKLEVFVTTQNQSKHTFEFAEAWLRYNDKD